MKLVTIEQATIGNKTYIFLFTRDGPTRQKIVIDDFQPYFYILEEEYSPDFHPNKKENLEKFKTLTGETVIKFYVQTPGDVPHFRKMFSKTWEADVPFCTRYLIDKIPKLEPVNLRVQYTDIEWDQETDQIISIAVYDNYLNKCIAFVWRKDLKPKVEQKNYVFPKTGYRFNASIHYYSSRESMLQDYIKFVRQTDPDVLTGWYFTKYDMPGIINSINTVKGLSAAWLSPIGKAYVEKERFYGQDVVVKGRVVWDTLKAYEKLQPTGLPDASLEAIAQKELGEGKYPLDKPISWLWRNNIEALVEYNCKDSVLVYRIDNKCKILDYYDSLRRWVGCEWNHLFSATQMWDTYILRKVHDKVVLPTKKRVEIERIKGAEVFTPQKGVHEWVVVLDLKSLYPSNIVTFNMSPETLVRGKPEPNRKVYNLPNGVSFYAEPVGLFPSILMELDEERNKYKALEKQYPFGTSEYYVYFHLQEGIKKHKNALYGASVHENFRLATRDIGKSTTFVGRKVVNRVRQRLIDKGFKVLYGDSVSGDTKVAVIGKQRNLIEIEKLFQYYKSLNLQKKFKYSYYKHHDKEIIDFTPSKLKLKTISLNLDGHKINFGCRILKIIRHKCKKQLYEITTESGKKVKVTKDHSLIVLRDNKIKNVKPTDVKFSDFVITVSGFPQKEKKPCVIVPKVCKRCKKIYRGEKEQKFCCKQCYWEDLKTRSNWSKGLTKETDERIKRRAESVKKANQKSMKRPEVREKLRKIALKYWKNSNFVKKQMFARKIRPNKIELKLKELFPKLEYVGDGTLVIGGRCPDFKVKGQMKLVEFFGDYWHKKQDEKIKVNHFKKYGYKTLVIWEHELKKGYNFVKEKVNKFIEDCLEVNIEQIISIKKLKTKEIFVYDLEVEKNHNFLANGIIVHNTDSVFYFSKKNSLSDIIEEMESVVEDINSDLKNLVEELGGDRENCHIRIEPKKIYRHLLITQVKSGKRGAKKRYAGRVVWAEGKEVDELDIMGFEFRRSNTSQLTRNLQKKIFRVLFKYEPREKLKAYIKKAKEKLASADYEYFGIPQSITKPFGKYKTDNPWVRGAKWSNEYLGLKFTVGDKPKILYVRDVPKDYPKTDVMAFRRNSDVPPGTVVDVEKMFEKAVIMKLEQILDAANLSVEEIVYGQTSLDQF